MVDHKVGAEALDSIAGEPEAAESAPEQNDAAPLLIELRLEQDDCSGVAGRVVEGDCQLHWWRQRGIERLSRLLSWLQATRGRRPEKSQGFV